MHAPHNFGVHERLARESSIPLLLVVVVERSAKENALACSCGFLCELEPANLHQHGACFGDDDYANDGEEKSGLHKDEHDANRCAKADRTRIAHVNFSRRAVEPQISEQRASDSGRKREKFVAAGEVRYAQVLAKDKVSTDVSHKSDKEHACHDGD